MLIRYEKELRESIEKALIKVAHNVCKHTIQRSGWHEKDECFLVDLREAEEEIMEVIRSAFK